MRWIVYGLTDPRSNLIRYIGRSKADGLRLRAHVNGWARENVRRSAWVGELHANGLKPGHIILHRSRSWRGAVRAETHAINVARFLRLDILNVKLGDSPSKRGRMPWFLEERLRAFLRRVEKRAEVSP